MATVAAVYDIKAHERSPEEVMFEEVFDGASRVQALRDSPGGPLLEGFAKELFQVRYAEMTARRHIRAAEHLIFWSDSEGIPFGPGHRDRHTN